MKNMLIAILLLLMANSGWAVDQSKIEKLELAVTNAGDDFQKVDALIKLGTAKYDTNRDEALAHATEGLELAQAIDYEKGIADCMNSMGNVHYARADYPLAMSFYTQSLDIREQLEDSMGIARSLANIALIYRGQSMYRKANALVLGAIAMKEAIGDWSGYIRSSMALGNNLIALGDYEAGLEVFLKALRVAEKYDLQKQLGFIHTNIGLVYEHQKDEKKARAYYEKALKLGKEMNSKAGISASLASLGNLCLRMREDDKAIDYYKRVLELDQELEDRRGEAITYNNIGVVYERMEDYPMTLEYYFKSLKLFKEIKRIDLVAISLNNIGGIYAALKQYKVAIDYIQRGLHKADSIEHLNYRRLICENLSATYEEMGQFKQALTYYKLASIHKDSLFNEDKSKGIGKLEAKYEFERAEAERIRIVEEERVASAAVERRRNNLQYSGILIFLVLVFALVFMLGKISMPVRLAEGMVFFAFLLFFEFTLVLLDPYIEAYSSGAPALKLAFNAVLAGLIFPLHSFFEGRVKGRILV